MKIYILVGLISLFILLLRIHMINYFKNKLDDMNNCFGIECEDCEKYGNCEYQKDR